MAMVWNNILVAKCRVQTIIETDCDTVHKQKIDTLYTANTGGIIIQGDNTMQSPLYNEIIMPALSPLCPFIT